MRGRQRAFLMCLFWYDSPDAETERKPWHTQCRNIASPLYEFLYVTPGFLFGKKSFHTGGRERASLLYSQTQRKSGHTGGRDMVSPRCGFACGSSSFLNGRRALYTWGRSKESRQRGFLCVSSGYWIWQNFYHKRCRGRADILCSRKASLLNASGRESWVGDLVHGRQQAESYYVHFFILKLRKTYCFVIKLVFV